MYKIMKDNKLKRTVFTTSTSRVILSVVEVLSGLLHAWRIPGEKTLILNLLIHLRIPIYCVTDKNNEIDIIHVHILTNKNKATTDVK